MKAFHWQPISASCAARAAAMGEVTVSVMRVTFSLGAMRRQVVTAERAPAMNSAG